MSESAVERIERIKMQVIAATLINTADDDYITARWCALNGLQTNFYWMAAQALEKYSKAILAANSVNTVSFGHKLDQLTSAVFELAGELLPSELEPVDKTSNQALPKCDSRKLIRKIANYGNPNNRYLEFGHQYHHSDLFSFDCLMFALRRLIVNLSSNVPTVLVAENGPLSYRQKLTQDPAFRINHFLNFDSLLESIEASELQRWLLIWNSPFNRLSHDPKPMRHVLTSFRSTAASNIHSLLELNDEILVREGIEIAKWFAENFKISKELHADLENRVSIAKLRIAELGNS